MTHASETRDQIGVLIVDDSAFMRTALSRMIGSDPDLNVLGTARSGAEALERIGPLNPDVVTLDVEMPGLDGLQTLRRIMAQSPRPVIMVSAATVEDAETTFNALSAGAFDYVPKRLSSTSLDIAHIQADLIAKIKAAAHSRLPHSVPRKLAQSAAGLERDTFPHTPSIVAIGTSTGGPKALQEILPLLTRDLSVPILIVQHMPMGFTTPFALRLNALCQVPIREAAHQEAIQAGTVYIAPAGIHMTVERHLDLRATICLSPHPENHLHIPSVDILMQSIAATYHSLSMGVIMTGMGSDGVLGMKAIHREGGLTLGQDEASCTVYGMPKACAELGLLHRIVPLSQIPQQIMLATRARKRA
ncbi:MAG TPA: chemotaxis response regulator protein-glutamate methylesterase [Terriglobales bacterium]|nr:chemotaxis response regulator protein-glutamate methylesterase [Terriglobales bacterium]